MKKSLLISLVAFVSMAFCVGVYAGVSDVKSSHGEAIEVEMQGRGACTMPNCKCPKFNQRPGYYQCWCGHQSFNHK